MEVRKGYKQTEVGIIPEDWEVFPIRSIITYTKGYPFKSKEYSEAGIRIIRVSDTNANSIKEDGKVYIDSKFMNLYKQWALEEYDLIVTTVGSKPPMYDSLVGKPIIVNGKNRGSLLNQNAVSLRSKSGNINNQFIIYFNLKRKRYLNYIEEIFRGNANQASITLEDLFKFQIPLPPTLAEQEAIATVLSDTDALVSRLETLLSKKLQIKQGTMQELLTGKRRLPGFGKGKGYKQTEVGMIPEDWGVIPFIHTINTYIDYRGRTPKKLGLSWGGGDILALSANNVVMGKIDPNKEANLGSEELYKKWMVQGECEKGDILLTMEAPLGNVTQIPDSKKYILSQRVILIKPKQSLGNNYFTHYLKGYYFQNQLSINSTGTTAKGIQRKKLDTILIYFPPTLAEQTAIASVLSDMDSEIETLEKKISKYKEIKQGMMQKLLTGEIRLV